jgi:GNAT superfamily N-acetyltransferase
MINLITKRKVPGILAYVNNQTVGWCSVAPRVDFPVLEKSRFLKRKDSKPVWSVVCFYIHKIFRKKGMTVELLRAAKKYVKMEKGRIIKGYPVESKLGETADAFACTGLASAFLKAGFLKVERRPESRPIMRLFIK